MSNPFVGLLNSRKFWIAVLDMVVSLCLYFVGKYAPGMMDDIKIIIASAQPVVLILIASIAWEDAAAKRSGTFRQ